MLHSSDPGSSGCVSSSRCLGTRISLHQRALRDESKMRNLFWLGRAIHSKEPRPEGSQGRTAAAHVCALACRPEAQDGGAGRDRTDDLKLAKLPLSQLSYGPILFGLKRRRLRPQPWLHAQKCAARIRACGSSSQSQISQGWSSMPKALLGRPAAAHVCAKAVRRMSHIMVGLGGLEPPTSRLSSARSNQLSYKPEP